MILTMQEKKALRREIGKWYQKAQSGQEKARSQGQKPYQAGKPPEKQISVRTYSTDADKKPGLFEIDTVHYCRYDDSGKFCLTLTAADVYPSRVELHPLLNKAHKMKKHHKI